MKKIIALLLVLSFVFAAAACAGGSGEKNETAGTKAAGTDTGRAADTDRPGETGGKITTEAPETEPPFPLDVVDYDGRSFRIVLDNEGDTTEFFIMEDSDNLLDSALYNRNQRVQDRYNVTITTVYTGGEGLFGHVTAVSNAILADEDAYDLTTSMAFASGPLIMNGCLLDWNKQAYTDLDASWWVQSINNKFEIDGHIFTVVGDTSVYALLYTYAMMYNRTLGDTYSLTDEVFEKIRSGEWTMDYFSGVVSKLYKDIDGENGPSYGDQFGLAVESLTNLDNYTFAFDIPMLNNNTENGLEFVFSGDRLHGAVDKIMDLYWSNPGTGVDIDPVDSFINGRSVFATILLNDCFSTFRSMKDDYTILPYPKYDENQKEYLTGMMDNYKVMGMPITVPDADFVSLITEAINYEAERTLYPAYLEDSLQNKYKRDEETVEMLEILLKGRNADFGTLLQNNLDNISVWFRWMIQSKTNTMSSFVAEREEYLKDLCEAVVNKYRENSLY